MAAGVVAIIRVILRSQELRGRHLRLLAERLSLLHNLVPEDGKVEQDQDYVCRAERVRIEASKADIPEDFCEVTQCFSQDNQQVQRVEKDEGQEVDMVSIPEAIVDEWAVVIKVLYALPTYGAMEGCL